MTSPSPARSKTTPSSGKLSAGHIVKKYQRLRKTGLLYLVGTASTSHTAAEN